MLASRTPQSSLLAQKFTPVAHSALVRPYGTRLLITPTQQQQLRQQRSLLAARSMPEDLDSMLITRRALSGLEAPEASQHKRSDSTISTGSSISASEVSASDSSSISGSSASSTLSSVDWEDVQAHKRAAVQQAYINNSLAFGFSAGGLVFPYYGE